MKSFKLTMVLVCIFVLGVASLSAQTYYYAWGGTETIPQAALTGVDSNTDDLWAIRVGGTTEGGLVDNFLEADEGGGEQCPNLTMTIPGGSIDAGTYAVYQINGTGTAFPYYVTVNTFANSEYRTSDVTNTWILVGLVASDASTDIVILGEHLPLTGRTRLDAVKLERIDDLYYMWGGPETDNPTAFSWDWGLLDMLYQLRDATSNGAVAPNMPTASPGPYEGNLPALILELDRDENAWDAALGTAPDLTMTIPHDNVPEGTYTLWAWDPSYGSWGYELKAPGGEFVATAQYDTPWLEIGTFDHGGVGYNNADIVIESRSQMPYSDTDRHWIWPIKLEKVGDVVPVELLLFDLE